VNQYFGTHVEADATIPSQNTPAITPASSAEGKPVVKFDANLMQKEINILGNLLEDRFKNTVSFEEEEGMRANVIVSTGRWYAET